MCFCIRSSSCPQDAQRVCTVLLDGEGLLEWKTEHEMMRNALVKSVGGEKKSVESGGLFIDSAC